MAGKCQGWDLEPSLHCILLPLWLAVSNSALEGSPHPQFQGEVSFWFLYGKDKASQELMAWINEMFHRATHGSWEGNFAESPCLKAPL